VLVTTALALWTDGGDHEPAITVRW